MLKLPRSWSDITIDQFIEIDRIAKSEITNKDELYFHLVSLLADLPISDLESMDYDEFLESTKDLGFLIQTPPAFQPKKTIETKLGKLHLKNNFNSDLTNGEFIDLEYLIQNDNYIQNIKMILAVFYRVRISENDGLHNEVFEPYGNYIQMRSELFGNQKVGDVFGVISQFLEFREEFFKKYEGLFDSTEEEEFVELAGESMRDRQERKKESETQSKIKKWGWNVLMYQLAGNDALKVDDAYGLPFLFSMNLMSMKKELSI